MWGDAGVPALCGPRVRPIRLTEAGKLLGMQLWEVVVGGLWGG